MSQTEELAELFRGENRSTAARLIQITNDMDDYWPLSVRQVYYQGVAHGLFLNVYANYKRTSKILTTLRRELILPWGAFEDRTRRMIDKRGQTNVQGFASDQLDQFLNPKFYQRCYVQKQENYVEISIEKDALSTIMEEAVWMFCTRVNVTRGQTSATMVNDMARRFEAASMRGQHPILLHFGDLDPSGIAIPKSICNALFEHHSIKVDVRRAALNPNQVDEYDLPASIDAAKTSDPNYRAWVNEFGKICPVELDAIHPKDLIELVMREMKKILDMSAVEVEREQEMVERMTLKKAKRNVQAFCQDNYPELFL